MFAKVLAWTNEASNLMKTHDGFDLMAKVSNGMILEMEIYQQLYKEQHTDTC